MNKSIIFISGHADLSQELFDEYYAPFINIAANNDSLFVVGDDYGCSKMAQTMLANILPEDQLNRVTVFYLKDTPRNLVSYDFVQCEGFKSDEEKNAAMTACSNGDISFIFGNRINSDVAKNILRRVTPDYNYSQFKKTGNTYFWTNLFKYAEED